MDSAKHMEAQLIDMPRFVERMEGDRELILEVFEVFMAEVPERRGKFEKALAAMDLEALTMLAHALKGASGTLQAELLREACSELEKAGRAGDADSVREVAPKVIALLGETAARMLELKATV
jgi:HPt (histidine-containing phosphotransfer) domain-containing protein